MESEDAFVCHGLLCSLAISDTVVVNGVSGQYSFANSIYYFLGDKSESGRPFYITWIPSSDSLLFLYWVSSGAWYIGANLNEASGYLKVESDVSVPYLQSGSWKVFDGTQFVADPSVNVAYGMMPSIGTWPIITVSKIWIHSFCVRIIS